MIYHTFNEYLMHICMEENADRMLVDDEWPDFFDGWILDVTTEDMIKYADRYGDEKKLEGMKQMSDFVANNLKEGDR